ncbi:serpin A12 isoform X3 [Erinaceus europaeus]|uniref:Serpin A12 isoform X3 n=1 Tax=Erinaceus europaeus TaxID=9365 RepID=A0ABM3WK92_ERIEU|nr:serpin A12 isoform X3 [Erinaceus europaeus]
MADGEIQTRTLWHCQFCFLRLTRLHLHRTVGMTMTSLLGLGLRLGLLLAGLVPLQGLLEPGLAPWHPGVLRERKAAQELARRNTAFGLKLFRKLVAHDSGGNVFFSPFSISMAFAMLSLGAQDSTLAEIREGFLFGGLSDRALHEGFSHLLRQLEQSGPDLSLALQNALFIDHKLRPQPQFLTDAKRLYGADTVPADFHNMEATARQVNDYVSQKTHGKITDLVRSVAPGTVMLLVNCIFLQAKWKHEFDPKETRQEDFFLSTNRSVKVEMMSRRGEYQVGHNDQLSCSVLEMPYEGDVTVTFILPDEGKMEQVERAMGLDAWDGLMVSCVKRVVDVFVPKFTITGSYDLKRTLSYMGVSKIFEEQGELTGISPHRSLKVGKAVHKAKLKMDERGVEVAAGTGAQTLPMETPVTYKLNRPFLMILSDKTMQSVLFLGKLANLSGK